MKNLKSYLQDENGQTSTEYILLLAVVALIVIKFGKEANSKLKDLTESIFGSATTVVNKIDAEIESGW